MHPKHEPTNLPSPSGRGEQTFRFDVFRYDASGSVRPGFQSYELNVTRQTSVLEGLLRIQDEQDPSLAFRYSCRGAVCGSCGMSINGRLSLACRVQLHLLPGRQVVLEPLPGLDVVKDLVVDMDPFWKKYERIQPWLHAQITAAEGTRMTEPQRQRIDQFVNCILCGLCYSACPVTKSDDGFTGPAALAKLYRFLADSRESRDGITLEQEDSQAGMWGCHTIMKCSEVCPKEVRATTAFADCGENSSRRSSNSSSGEARVKLEQSHLERRRFLCNMLGGAAMLGAGAALPLVQYMGNFRQLPPPDFLVLDKADYDLPPGKSRMLMYGPIPVLLLRTPPPESELRVFVATCTHLNCTVGYREEQNCIFCACHEGYYDTAGQVVSGPPPRPLRSFFRRWKDGKLIIALEEEKLAYAP